MCPANVLGRLAQGGPTLAACQGCSTRRSSAACCPEARCSTASCQLVAQQGARHRRRCRAAALPARMRGQCCAVHASAGNGTSDILLPCPHDGIKESATELVGYTPMVRPVCPVGLAGCAVISAFVGYEVHRNTSMTLLTPRGAAGVPE